VELVLLHSFESGGDLGLGGSGCAGGDGLVELEEGVLARLGGIGLEVFGERLLLASGDVFGREEHALARLGCIGLEVFGERLLLAASEVFGRCVPLRRLSWDIDDRVALVLLPSSEREGV